MESEPRQGSIFTLTVPSMPTEQKAPSELDQVPESAELPAGPTTVEELSQEELDAEMERIEQALGDTDEVKEFIPTKPLAADLPFALPSDI